jgi:hypothetical protein
MAVKKAKAKSIAFGSRTDITRLADVFTSVVRDPGCENAGCDSLRIVIPRSLIKGKKRQIFTAVAHC